MRKKIRVIIRPWVPRNIPYTIPTERVEQVLATAYPKLKKVLYIGWARRKVEGKRELSYLAATANTTIQARTILKQSENYGEDVWNLGV